MQQPKLPFRHKIPFMSIIPLVDKTSMENLKSRIDGRLLIHRLF